MTARAKILPGSKLIVIGYTGLIRRAEEEGLFEAAADPNYHLGFDELILLAPDATYANFAHEISRADAREYVELLRQAKIGPKRSAFVCSNELQRAMARLFSAYVRADGPELLTVENFPSLAQAIDWLQPSKPERSLDSLEITRVACELGQSWCCSEDEIDRAMRKPPFQLRFLAPAELAILCFKGHLTADTFAAAEAAIRAHKNIRPDFDSLIVLAPDASFSGVGVEASQAQAHNFVARATGAICKRSAFVCANEMQLSLARLFRAHVHASGKVSAEIGAFSSVSCALDWIEPVKPERKLSREHVVAVLREMGQQWCLQCESAASRGP